MPAAQTTKRDLREALDNAKAESTAAWNKLETAKDEAKKSGIAKLVDPEDKVGSDAFAMLDEVGLEYDKAKQREETINDRILRVMEIEGEIEPVDTSDEGRRRHIENAGKRIGRAEQIVQGEAFQNAIKLISKSDTARLNGSVDLGNLMSRDEFRNALITGESATSAGAFLDPELRSEFIDLARRPTSILDLVTVTSTDRDSIEWITQTSRPTAAAFVAEATNQSTGTKPEGTAAFARISAEVVTVAEWVAMTRQSVQDVPRVQGIIESDLLYDLYLKIENSMLSGAGGDEFTGIFNAAGTGNYTIGTDDASENVMDAIHRAITLMRLDEEEPDGVLVRADTWQDMRLAKDDNGNYLYGPPSTAGDMQVWGKRVMNTNAMGADQALVGAFKRGAEIAFRTGVQTFLADQHSDWMIKNLLLLLSEIRAAFLVKRAECFVEVDLSA